MTSRKLAYFRKIAREKWIDGTSNRIITAEEIQAFNTGFNMAWRSILIDKRIYRTFNVHWKKSDANVSCLRDNDNNQLAAVGHTKYNKKRFKYIVVAYTHFNRFEYMEFVDQNDVRRIEKELKVKILNDFIQYKERTLAITHP